MRSLCILLLTAMVAAPALAPAPAGEAPPAFAMKPTASRDGDKVRIEFAAAAPTDCAVYVLDAQGKAVRHLAAGVLGEKPPEPLKPGLAQTLVWDGKDDLGKPAGGGPFKVRVGLGLGLKPEKVHGGPGGLSPCALAVGPGGELYALGMIGNLHAGDATALCRVFDREGKYLRTIMPWPGELAPEKAAGFGQLDIAGQGRIPFVHNGESRSLYPDLRQPSRCGAAVTGSGRFIFADSNSGDGIDNGYGQMFMMSVEKDGGCPAQGFLGAKLAGNSMGCPALALSPDGKTLYVTGLADGHPKKGVSPAHAVFKLAAEAGKDAKPEVFAGDPAAAGADDRHLSDPRGVAVDGQGNVYVSDFGNGRIVAFKPDGSRLGQVKVDKPDFLAVHPKTGVIYALTGELANKLLRISGLKDGKVTAGPELKAGAGMQKNRDQRPVLALDAGADPPVIWVGCNDGYSGWSLKRFEDTVGSFAGERDGFAKGSGSSLLFFDLALDRKRDVLWARDGGAHLRTCTVINGKTGERRSATIPYPPKTYAYSGAILTWGRDDFLYHEIADKPENGKGIYRFTVDLRPAPFGEVKYVPTVGSIHLLARGLDVNARGEGVAVKQSDEAGSRVMNHVMAFGPDGKVSKDRLVPGLFAGDCSARIDDAGNVYVATCARPEGEIVPPEFKGQVPEGKKLPDGYTNWYPVLCGSIVKFGPAGGAFRTGERKIVVGYGSGRNQAKEMFIQGALWMKSGVSQVPLQGGAGGAHYCSCEQMRFDVDGFGRVFAPDTVRFQAVVLDTAGNPVGRFGTYGNSDSQLAGGAALRFAWPEFVLAGDEAVYIGDLLNRSILRATIAYAAEESCEVR